MNITHVKKILKHRGSWYIFQCFVIIKPLNTDLLSSDITHPKFRLYLSKKNSWMIRNMYLFVYMTDDGKQSLRFLLSISPILAIQSWWEETSRLEWGFLRTSRRFTAQKFPDLQHANGKALPSLHMSTYTHHLPSPLHLHTHGKHHCWREPNHPWSYCQTLAEKKLTECALFAHHNQAPIPTFQYGTLTTNIIMYLPSKHLRT